MTVVFDDNGGGSDFDSGDSGKIAVCLNLCSKSNVDDDNDNHVANFTLTMI